VEHPLEFLDLVQRMMRRLQLSTAGADTTAQSHTSCPDDEALLSMALPTMWYDVDVVACGTEPERKQRGTVSTENTQGHTHRPKTEQQCANHSCIEVCRMQTLFS
jgi:hypothetical protein